jgi:aspartyl-tRNA(Asn)/glutamyl-tRNA(Gln) amidotransferase subunit A
MTAELSFLSLSELASLLAGGKTSSRAVVEGCLARIDTLDGKLHAFVEVWHDDALAMADACDLERRAGLARGPLHGVPIALKDLFHVQGRPTTAGAVSWRGRIADRTATCVQRLLAAGMIPLGKTHMVEFAFGSWGTNEPMGAPRNPWDPMTHRVAGGSSSGSAVAVAAGLAPCALGSDTGGSVRIPAALCGLTGLKVTYGTISLHDVVPLSGSLDSIGPITRTVDDAALLAAAMAGFDPNDPATRNMPPFEIAEVRVRTPDLRGRRIAALPPEQFPEFIDAAVVRARDDAIAVLRGLGAIVENVPFPFDFQALGLKNGRLIAAEGYAFHRAYIEDEAVPFDPGVRARMLSGKTTSAADYIDAMAERRRAAAHFATWMRGCDALLTPTVPFPAIPVGDVDESVAPMAMFTRAGNYLGACALSLPAGFSAQGLPVGVQLVGAPHAEGTLVEIGRAFQHATDWHRRRPPVGREPG